MVILGVRKKPEMNNDGRVIKRSMLLCPICNRDISTTNWSKHVRCHPESITALKQYHRAASCKGFDLVECPICHDWVNCLKILLWLYLIILTSVTGL